MTRISEAAVVMWLGSTVYFDGKKKLLPKTTDLSYFNWRTNACYANDSPNFKVDASNGN